MYKEAKNKKESMMSRAKCIGGKLMMIFQIGSSCFAYFLSESKDDYDTMTNS